MHNRSRRQFLFQATKIGMVIAASGLSRGLEAEPLGLPIGIQLWAVNDALKQDPEGTLKKLAKIGFRQVEPAGFAGLTPKDFRHRLDDAGLVCPSSVLVFDLDNLGKAFEDANVLGAHYAVSTVLFKSIGKLLSTELTMKSAMSIEEAKRTAEVANRIGEAAKRAGLQFVLHNHDREFVDLGNGAVGYDIILRETDPALVQFEVDCGWMIFAGRDPIDYFRKYPGRIPLIHVKDFLAKQNKSAVPGAEDMRGAELGRGVIDYKPILAAAKQADVKHCFVEQEGPFSRMNQLDAAKVAYDYFQAIK